MRALVRLHTAVVGRVHSHESCQVFGGLLPRRSRHFIRGNIRRCSTKTETHNADLVLDVHYEPTTYPAGCDKDDYRRYFQRSRVYILGGPLENRLGYVTEALRGLRPDAVVLLPLLRLPSNDTEMTDRSPLSERVLPPEVAVAFKEAKALPNCTVVCDRFPIGIPQLARVWQKRPKDYADIDQRVKELEE